jgi:hypothetical protein
MKSCVGCGQIGECVFSFLVTEGVRASFGLLLPIPTPLLGRETARARPGGFPELNTAC